MPVKSNVNGLDDLQHRFKDIPEGMTPRTTDEWLKRIETTARQLCNYYGGQRINFRKSWSNQYDFEFDGSESLEYGIEAIKIYLDHMPIPQQLYYNKLLTELEKRKKGIRYI